jgi:hypothetical protein
MYNIIALKKQYKVWLASTHLIQVPGPRKHPENSTPIDTAGIIPLSGYRGYDTFVTTVPEWATSAPLALHYGVEEAIGKFISEFLWTHNSHCFSIQNKLLARRIVVE